MANLEDIISDIDSLPALPATAARLTSMLMSGESDIAEVAEIVRIDEALSITVLRYANSSMFGRPGREFNLRESIIRLGNATVLKIVMQQQIGQMLRDGGVAFGLERGAMWRGALGGAFAAEHLAKAHGFEDSDLCFVCGLLRDIGKLALDVRYGSDYVTKVNACLTDTMTFQEAEREAIGTDHAEVGAALAEHWQLPERICTAIRHHHTPPAEAPEHDTLIDLVHAADIVCLWAGLAVGYDGLQYHLSPHVKESLSLNRRSAEIEITTMWHRVREIEDAMNGTTHERHVA